MGAHVRHIEISNFKSLRHVSLDGCRRINVFIGAPNSGKSAILEALSLLSYIQPDNIRPITDFCRMKFGGELFFEGNTVNHISISVDDVVFADLSLVGNLSLEMALLFDPNNSGPDSGQRVYFSEKNATDHHQITPTPSGQPVVKKYTYSNTESGFRTSRLELEFPYGGNLGEIMRFQPKLRGEVARLFEQEVLKLTMDTENGSLKGLRMLKDESYYLIPFYQMADTLQRLVFHKAAIMSNRNSVLLFEEPEAHLYPPYMGVFTGDLLYNRELNNQYFISTHSELILNGLMDEGRPEMSVFLVALKDGATVVKRLDDQQLEDVYTHGVDLFFNIESYLD